MKRNAIAVLLSVALAVSGVGTAPAWAEENTVQAAEGEEESSETEITVQAEEVVQADESEKEDDSITDEVFSEEPEEINTEIDTDTEEVADEKIVQDEGSNTVSETDPEDESEEDVAQSILSEDAGSRISEEDITGLTTEGEESKEDQITIGSDTGTENEAAHVSEMMEIIDSSGVTDESGREANEAVSELVSVDDIFSSEIIPTDVTSASDGCVLVGAPGKYISDPDAALERINEIRWEACQEGVLNPNTGQPLTTADYVPIKWSKELEYIARIRAAESAFTGDHIRTNGEEIFKLTSPGGIKTHNEVLAWNWSNSMIMGIDQWYEEKTYWVNQTPNEETGHYTAMIKPTNRYVGLGTFCSDVVSYHNTTAGEFSFESGLDESRMSFTGECVQILEMTASKLSTEGEISGKMRGIPGEKSKHLLTMYPDYKCAVSNVYLMSDVSWSSSDTGVVTISSDGETTAVEMGSATIRAVSADGSITSEKEFVVKEVQIIDSGQCGDDAVWAVTGEDDDLTLTISGSGEMYDFRDKEKREVYTPWISYTDKIRTVVIENGITSIGDGAFHNCRMLKVNIPDGVVRIGEYAFENCKKLTYITIPGSVNSIGDGAFCDCENLIGIIIPDGVTSIGESTFAYCFRIFDFVIPNSVTEIGDYAFLSCYRITDFEIPDSVTSIGRAAFISCGCLTSIKIPDGVTYIRDNTFAYCSSLKNITMPGNMAVIDDSAFSYDDALADVYYGGPEADWAEIRIGSENDPLLNAVIHFNSPVYGHVHSWNTEYTIDEEATCTEEGSESFHCRVCGVKKMTSVHAIPKKEHNYGDWTVTKNATCTKCGSRERICTDCGDRDTEEIPANGHKWNEEYTVDRKPTNKEEGEKSIHCSVCDAKKEGSEVPIPVVTKDLGELKITGIENKTYTGKEITQELVIKDGDNKLVQNTDYTVTYYNNVNVGTASVNIQGIGGYTGTVTITFMIKPGKTTRGDMFNLANNVKVTWKEVPGAAYYKVYREGVTDPEESLTEPVIVTERLIGWDQQPGLTNGHAYRYKIVASLTGKDDSSGDSPLSYSKLMYRLKTVVIRSAKNTAPGKVTVKYDKTISGDSYVLQYSENEDLTGAKTKVVLGANNTSYTIGGLKKGKTYYISIRVRKKVNGIDYYTTFGVPKKITVSK